MTRRLRRMTSRAARTRREEGATAVEFALVLPVFLLLVGGVLALGLRMFYSAVAEHSVRQGLREATVPQGGYSSAEEVRAAVANSAKGVLSPDAFECSGCGSGQQGDEVTVTVTYEIEAVTAASKLMPVPFLQDAFERLATVTTSAEGRLE